MLKNVDLRNTIKTYDMRLWELADLLKISEATMTRKLRHELSKDEKVKIIDLIKNCKSKEEKVNAGG